jgi:flagellar assembly protein FliH
MSFHVVPKPRPRAPAAPRPEEAAAEAGRRAEIETAVATEVARRRAAAEEAGRREGEASARLLLAAQEAAVAAAAVALQAACRQLAAPLAGREAELAELVMDMGLELARHVVGVAVTADQSGLRALVEKLLLEAAAERGPRQSVVVRVNPADHAQIDAKLLGEGVHLLADAAVTCGGAKVEIVAPDGDPLEKTEWDATIESRIAALREALRLDGEGVA